MDQGRVHGSVVESIALHAKSYGFVPWHFQIEPKEYSHLKPQRAYDRSLCGLGIPSCYWVRGTTKIPMSKKEKPNAWNTTFSQQAKPQMKHALKEKETASPQRTGRPSTQATKLPLFYTQTIFQKSGRVGDLGRCQACIWGYCVACGCHIGNPWYWARWNNALTREGLWFSGRAHAEGPRCGYT